MTTIYLITAGAGTCAMSWSNTNIHFQGEHSLHLLLLTFYLINTLVSYIIESKVVFKYRITVIDRVMLVVSKLEAVGIFDVSYSCCMDIYLLNQRYQSIDYIFL